MGAYLQHHVEYRTLSEDIRGRVGSESGLDATVKFVFPDEGVIFVDGAASPNTVSNADREAACPITMAAEDFQSMLAGELDATMAFMTGKLRVDGNMAIAMNLQKVI